jgi:hypothetical protein
MISFLLELAQALILAGSLLCAYAVAYGGATWWGKLMCRFADSGCTCNKGGWNPSCPVHGREDREPFPGGVPW